MMIYNGLAVFGTGSVTRPAGGRTCRRHAWPTPMAAGIIVLYLAEEPTESKTGTND